MFEPYSNRFEGDLTCKLRVIVIWQGLNGKTQHALSSEKEEKCHNVIILQQMLRPDSYITVFDWVFSRMVGVMAMADVPRLLSPSENAHVYFDYVSMTVFCVYLGESTRHRWVDKELRRGW